VRGTTDRGEISQVLSLDLDLIDPAPTPRLIGFVRTHDWMSRLLEVSKGVPARRLITAAYVATGKAQAQMDPPTAARETLLATTTARLHRSESRHVAAAGLPAQESVAQLTR
jgi:hypothetical protein